MRFVTFARGEQTRLGMVAGDHVLDLNQADPNLPSDMKAFLAAGSEALGAVLGVHRLWREGRLDPNTLLPRAELSLLAPIRNPSKIIAAGVNYLDHCREAGIQPPGEPVLFAKFPSSVTGPGQAIEWDPALTEKVDYEAELAVVVGRRARHVPAAAAFDIIFGYTCANDVTARDLQARDRQWVRGKSLDTFCPLGPEIVTKDEVPHPQNLGIACRVNGEPMQDSSTAEMIFGIPALIEFATRAFTLMPGDLILTGTPHGVGAYRQPPVLLRDGDVVEVEIEGVGLLRNRCREHSGSATQDS